MNAPMRVRQVVLKVNSRCNLSCSYCYVYNSVDTGWRSQPRSMDGATVALAARRIAEHAERHELEAIDVVLHGGEPLLAGHERIESALQAIRAAAPPGTAVRYSMQTNGTLLDEAFLEMFVRHDVRVGVSLDGDAIANDRHRIYPNGAGSYERAAAGIELMQSDPRYRRQFAGLLTVVDVRNDPLAVYRGLLAFRPPSIDLLLPHANWESRPPHFAGQLSYAAWLIAIFDEWYASETPPRMRLFQSIILRWLGGDSDTEAIGGDLPGIVTVETDGSYELADSLKTTVDGGARTGLTLEAQSLDDVLEHVARAAPAQLPTECRSCPVADVCGGGLRAHRYRAGSGFDNRSVYCSDLFQLITHVERPVLVEAERR
ncbi:FxsB family radical SAM/SPASM domain protein [Dactylosporangium darangshiense]|uniref:FxsB family radical SAM/SPASM domain protein n=1 Tax=Dactylosporangium darangshiense TaxID=579108 RepID=A0ABP8DLM9_9ACTN